MSNISPMERSIPQLLITRGIKVRISSAIPSVTIPTTTIDLPRRHEGTSHLSSILFTAEKKNIRPTGSDWSGFNFFGGATVHS